MTKFVIYVLGLEDNKYYVGLTSQSKGVTNRFKEHSEPDGQRSALWCKKHKPVAIVREIRLRTVDYAEALNREAEITVDYVKKYGRENVRGATACSVEQDKFDESYEHMLSGIRFTKSLNKARLATYNRFKDVQRGDRFYKKSEDGAEFYKTVVDVDRSVKGETVFFLTDTMGIVRNGGLWSDKDIERIGYYLDHERPVENPDEFVT
jgi:predicted GIY-YIG superfamily endonuclease